MTTTTSPATPHVAIVGAGIIGLSHAVAAIDAGYRVTVIEQDAQAVLASVRNFGHVCTSVQSGELGELAREANPLWRSIAERMGVEARASGTLVVATNDTEHAVINELLTERTPAGARMLDRAGTVKALGLGASAAAASSAASALFLPDDLTANPRTAVSAIAAWVASHERGEVRFRTAVHGVTELSGGGLAVETSRGIIEADRVVVAAGHLVGRLFPELAEARGVRECVLQMARVRAPQGLGQGLGLGPAVLTGTSMMRYGAFAGTAADALRAELAERRPELLEIDANVMFTQHPDGTLLVGDSHITHDTAPPFLDERWSEILLRDAAAVLGVDGLEVIERWQGIYATSTEQDILRASPMPGVDVVSVTTGVGMTTAPAIGARTIAAF